MEISLVSIGACPFTAELPHFVNMLPDKYGCPVCKLVLRNAMQLPCGHQICEPCIDMLFGESDNATCPVKDDEECEQPFPRNQIHKDMCTRREVMSLAVYCKNSDDGCKETPKWKNLKQHFEECEYMPVECDECHEKIPLYNLSNHIEMECSFRVVVCNHCSQNIPCSQMQSHLDHGCTDYPLNCANGCENLTLPRNEMECHLLSCPKRTIPCGYRSIGCEFFGVITEVEKHQVTATDQHLMLAKSFSGQTSDQNKALHKEIEENRHLKLTAQQLHQDNQRLKNEITSSIKSVAKDMKKKFVRWTEKLINMQRMVEHQPKLGETQDQAIKSFKEGDIKGSQEQITQLERLDPQGGRSQALVPQNVKNQLLDQDTFRRHVCDTFQPDTTSTGFKRPTAEMNVATGCPLFISHSVLENETNLKTDTIFIKAKLDLTEKPDS